jgi:hypothetical protein
VVRAQLPQPEDIPGQRRRDVVDGDQEHYRCRMLRYSAKS